MSQTSFAWQGRGRQSENTVLSAVEYLFLGEKLYHHYAAIIKHDGLDFCVGDFTVQDLGYQYYEGDYIRFEEQDAFEENKESGHDEENHNYNGYNENYPQEAGERNTKLFNHQNGGNGHFHQQVGKGQSDSSNSYNGNNGYFNQQAGARQSDLFNSYHNDRNVTYAVVPSDDALAEVMGYFIMACVEKGCL